MGKPFRTYHLILREDQWEKKHSTSFGTSEINDVKAKAKQQQQQQNKQSKKENKKPQQNQQVLKHK